MGNYIGSQLGDYRILELIGSGGMGQVYLAEHVHLRKKYALKILPEELAGDRNFVGRFHDEARVMAELRHPGIVQVHAMSSQDGVYFLVMDYVTGPDGSPLSLHDYLRGQPDGRLPEHNVRKWAVQIAEALAYAHRNGVVHRDIKPANILIDADENVKLTDFGLAKAVGGEFILSQIHQSIRQTLSTGQTRAASIPQDTLDIAATQESPRSGGTTSAESILGTYDYMAPEQRGEGTGQIDQRTDIYSFGVLLYRVLTGRRPAGRAKAPSEIVPGLSKRWDTIVDRCMADDPADRYALAEALPQELKNVDSRGGAGRLVKVALAAGLLAGLAIAGLYGWSILQGRQVHQTEQQNQTQELPQADQTPPAHRVGLVEAAEARSQAELKWSRTKSMDRGDGFGVPLDSIEVAFGAAETLFEQKDYGTASLKYQDVSDECERLTRLDGDRQLARQARGSYEQVFSSLDKDRLSKYGGDAWAKVAEQLLAAKAAGEDFAKAAAAYNQATLLLPSAVTAADVAWKDAEFARLMSEAGAVLKGLPAGATSLTLSSAQKQSITDAMRATDNAMAIKPADASALLLKAKLAPFLSPPKELALDLGKNVSMKLVLIPSGKFMMGSPDDEKDRGSDEGPQRHVTISRPFYMGDCEVTQEQYEAVMGTNPSEFKGAKNPVEQVSWNDATAFCKKLSARTGKTVRLPTEAEWEYACRGGSTTRFCYGDDADSRQLGDYAWYTKNSNSKTHPVGQKKANAWGLYDMHGNVWEWCKDGCVLRGGSWGNDPRLCRSAGRFGSYPDTGCINVGFRVVVSTGFVNLATLEEEDLGELAEILANPNATDELKQTVLKLLIKRDPPGIVGQVVKALPKMADNELREAIFTWLTKHPQPAVPSEIVRQWADETSTTSPDEPRYRLIVERISGTGWKQALLEGLNTPEFFARGSALEILAKRMDPKLLREQILQLNSRTEAVTVLQRFIQGFDYLPANQQELLSAITVYKLEKEKLQKTAEMAHKWTTDFGYRFNIRDFHLISSLAYDPDRPKMLRIPLVLELKKKLDARDHAHAKRGGYEGTGHHADEFMLQLEKLSVADLWNIYLLDEMLKRPRVQVALRLMAEKDRDDKKCAWGGLIFYENGHAEAILYPPSLESGENDLLFRPRKTTVVDRRDAICQFNGHFEKVQNSDRIGPTEQELLLAKQGNYYGLVLTSLGEENFCAHYYNPTGAVVSLGTFSFKKWP